MPNISVSSNTVCVGQSITASSSWFPTDLGSSLALWLDAADATTITQNSGAVSEWRDKSVNGRNAAQSNTSLQPIFNSNGITGNTTRVLNLPATIYSGKTKGALILVGSTGSSGGWGKYGTSIYAEHIPWFDNRIYSSFLTTDQYPVGNLSSTLVGPSIVAINHDGFTLSSRANGSSLLGSASVNFTNSPTTTLLFGQYSGYTLNEIIFLYDDSQVEKLEGYLAHKWGLTANLPAAHPHKTTAPTATTGTWSSNNSAVATINSSTGVITGVSAGTATFTFTSTGGCSATTSAVTVNARPTVTFTSQPGAVACANSNVTYTTQSGQSNYVWTVTGVLNTDYTITSGGVGLTSNTVTLKWLTTGSKTVTINYTNAGGCSATSATSSTATTVSNTLPTVSVSASYVCVGSTITASGWTPAALGASLALWLDAADAATITQSGGFVSQWNDKVAITAI
jgi:hypothetical protein